MACLPTTPFERVFDRLDPLALDHVLSVKENQERLRDDMVDRLCAAMDDPQIKSESHEYEQEKGHGRTEKRSVTVITDPEEGARDQDLWAGLKVVGCYLLRGADRGGQEDDQRRGAFRPLSGAGLQAGQGDARARGRNHAAGRRAPGDEEPEKAEAQVTNG